MLGNGQRALRRTCGLFPILTSCLYLRFCLNFESIKLAAAQKLNITFRKTFARPFLCSEVLNYAVVKRYSRYRLLMEKERGVE